MPDNEIRDQLTEIMHAASPGYFADYAEAILAAGWRPPARVIETYDTVQGLEMLPTNTVIRDNEGIVYERCYTTWRVPDSQCPYDSVEVALPATVLWQPEENPNV